MQMVDLLKEYLNSGDIQEAMRCLQELEVPHFHHELIYQVSASDTATLITILLVQESRSVMRTVFKV